MLVDDECSIRSSMSIMSPNVKSKMDRVSSNPSSCTSRFVGIRIQQMGNQRINKSTNKYINKIVRNSDNAMTIM